MATYYCTVADVADFLRIPVDANTVPNTTQIEKLINRAEARIERKTGHAWREVTVTRESHDLPYIYEYGWGIYVTLKHRNIRDISFAAGDRIEVWNGTQNTYTDITQEVQNYSVIPERGEVYIRGYYFTVMRKNRIRITYRYGDTTVPEDIEHAAVLMAAKMYIETSFRMDLLPMGTDGIKPFDILNRWQAEIDDILSTHQEWFVIP